MKKILGLIAIGGVVALTGRALGMQSAHEQGRRAEVDPRGEASEPRDVRRLFDGESLKDWTPTNFGGEREVKVVEGCIYLEAGYPLTGVTYQGELPKIDYELTVEGQKLRGNDFFAAITFPVQESHCTLVLGGWGGTITGLSCIDGSDASNNETTRHIRFDVGRWYVIRIRVKREQVECWLDGESIVNVPLEGRLLHVRDDIRSSCPLGICSFTTESRFRRIELATEVDEQR